MSYLSKVGDRIGALWSSDEETKTIFFLGYGTFQGNQVPPYGTIFQGIDYRSAQMENLKQIIENSDALPTSKTKEEWEKALDDAAEILGNPKLVMDDGEVFWGCECWWSDEAIIKKQLAAYEKDGWTVKKVGRADLDAKKKEYGY